MQAQREKRDSMCREAYSEGIVALTNWLLGRPFSSRAFVPSCPAFRLTRSNPHDVYPRRILYMAQRTRWFIGRNGSHRALDSQHSRCAWTWPKPTEWRPIAVRNANNAGFARWCLLRKRFRVYCRYVRWNVKEASMS